jgi:hypothetical protein
LPLLQATQLSLQLLSALAADSEAIPVLRHSKAIKPIVDLVHNVQQAPGTLQQWLLHALSHLAQNAAACEEMAAGGAGVALLQLLEAAGVHAPRAALMSTALVALVEGSRNARMSLVHAGVCGTRQWGKLLPPVQLHARVCQCQGLTCTSLAVCLAAGAWAQPLQHVGSAVKFCIPTAASA